MSTMNNLRQAAAGAPAKARPNTIHGMLDAYKGEITRALPTHMNADRLARVALTECRKTPALLQCRPESLFGAVIQAAQIGLEPGGALGHCYLIPFGKDVQFIVGYRGMIDLARRSGQIVSLEAHPVYAGDNFNCSFGLNSDLTHTPDWDNAHRANPDNLRFVYAVAKLRDGGVQFEVMSRAEVDAIRLRSKAGRSGPWVTDYAAMALKTVIRRLFKYLPVSIELQKAVVLDEQAEANIHVDHWNNTVIEGDSKIIDGDDVQFDTETGEVTQPIQHQAGDPAVYQPTADEIAAIQAREMAEAGEQAPIVRRSRGDISRVE